MLRTVSAVPRLTQDIGGEQHNRCFCLFLMLFERVLNECLKYSLVGDE